MRVSRTLIEIVKPDILLKLNVVGFEWVKRYGEIRRPLRAITCHLALGTCHFTYH